MDLAAEGKHDEALKFFEVEYQLDHFIGTLKTPYVAVMDGITSKYDPGWLKRHLTDQGYFTSGWWCWFICACTFPNCY